MREGMWLFGSTGIFHTARKWLDEYGVTARLDAIQETAIRLRHEAEQTLLDDSALPGDANTLRLFYPVSESDEWE